MAKKNRKRKSSTAKPAVKQGAPRESRGVRGGPRAEAREVPGARRAQGRNVPRGFTLRAECRGHEGPIRLIDWSPDGTRLASGSRDGSIRIWDGQSGDQEQVLAKGEGAVASVAWSPDGKMLVAGRRPGHDSGIEIWNAAGSKLIRQLPRTTSALWWNAGWSPDGRFLAASGSEGGLDVWDGGGLGDLRAANLRGITVVCAWSPDSRRVAVIQEPGRVLVFSVDSLETPAGEFHAAAGDSFYSVAWSADGRFLATGGDRRRVYVTDAMTLKSGRVLEEPRNVVAHIQFSPTGELLAGNIRRGPICLWRTDTWDLVAQLPARTAECWPSGLAFHPKKPALATLDDEDRIIRIWDLDLDLLLKRRRAVAPPARYQSAKVVLVGDTGVGKSGLALRLSGTPFRATSSTHARRVRTFDSGSVLDSSGTKVARESLLWDLAGQPGYRLVHQIVMDNAAVALVLFDARSETDPLGGAAYWSQALAQARSDTKIVKYLVAARTDRGGVGISQDRIDEFVKKHRFAGYFRTSAKTGEGVDALAAEIRKAIPWQDLPIINSTKLLGEVRAFLDGLRRKRKARMLRTLKELCAGFRQATNSKASEDDLRNCIRRLEDADEVKVLELTTLKEEAEEGDWVLLEPAFMDAYASQIIIEAKDEPDGIGHLTESKVLQGDFRMDVEERLPDRPDERLVLVEVVKRFLLCEIALRERIEGIDYLVFPSQYTRDAPFPGAQSYGIGYEFAGPVRNIFLTLLVRLAHSSKYRRREFWRDAAAYEPATGGRCIVLFTDLEEGRGRMSVFFEDGPSEDVKRTFLEYVYMHLKDRAVLGSVTRRRAYHCPACKYLMDDKVVEHRLAGNHTEITCPNCDTRSPLFDLLFAGVPASEEISARVREIDEDASLAKTRELAVTVLAGKRRQGEYDVFLSYNSDDRAAVLEIARNLKAVGLRPWVDVLDLIPGRPWQKELEKAIARVKCAAVFVGPKQVGPWQDREMDAVLQQFVKREARVIPVLLPGAAQEVDLPVFLQAFSWVDLRDLDPNQVGSLKNLIAGIIDRPPDETIWPTLESVLRMDIEQRQTKAIVPPSSRQRFQLSLDHDRAKLEEIDWVGIRAQLADQIGVPETALEIAKIEEGSLRLELEGDPDDLFLLYQMLMAGEPRIIEQFKRLRADPEAFLKDNRALMGQISVQVSESPGANISVGERNQQRVQQTTGESVTDILEALAQFQRALAGLTLDPEARESVDRDIAYAQGEARSSQPDRGIIARVVGKAIKVINDSGTLVRNVTALDTAATAVATWCGAHGSTILSFLKGP